MALRNKIKKIPAFSLYGESGEFPDVLHCERIIDRAHKHDWHIKPHRHLNLYQIFLITDGRASMTVDGTLLSLPTQSVAIVPKHSVHGFVFDKLTKGFVLSIPSAEVAAISSADIQLSTIFNRARIIPASEAIVNTLETIDREHRGATCARFSLLRSLTVQLACYLAASAVRTHQMVNLNRGKIADFQELARNHFTEGWKVADYAHTLGISTTHLNRLCKDVLGQSPKGFLHVLIIQEAKRLLAYTKIDIASVGYRIGFEDPSYFSRVFMRQTGQSPLSFRRMYDGSVDENP